MDVTPKHVEFPFQVAIMTTESIVKIGIQEAVDKIGPGKFQLILLIGIGSTIMSDAVEMTLFAILSPTLKCSSWKITHFQQAMLSTVVFFGELMKNLIS